MMVAGGARRPQEASVRRGWAISTGTTLVIGLSAFVVAPIAARALGPDGRGRLVVLQVLPQFLADLAAIGLPFAMVHFGARHPTSVRALLARATKPVLAGSAITMGIGLAAAPLLTDSAGDASLFRWYLLLCPLTALTTVANEAFRATGAYGAWGLVALGRGLSWPVALLIGVARAEPSLTVVVRTHLALAAVVMVAAQVAARRRYAHARDEPVATSAEFSRFGLHSIASTIPRSANAKIDQLLMTALVTRSELGLYAAAVGWSMITMPAMRGLSNIAMPHVSGSTGDQVGVRTRQVVSVGLVGVIALAALGVPATLLLWGPLYGADFSSARTAAAVMIPAALLLELGLVLGNVMRSLGLPLRVGIIELTAVGLSVIGVLAVTRVSPVLGPALVSLGVYLVVTMWYVRDIAANSSMSITALVDLRAGLRTVTRPYR